MELTRAERAPATPGRCPLALLVALAGKGGRQERPYRDLGGDAIVVALLGVIVIAGSAPAAGEESAVSVGALLDGFRAVDWDSRAQMRKPDPADEAWRVRLRAQHALMHMGSSAVPGLIDALGDHNRHVRALAATCLGVIGDPAARAGLTRRLLLDNDPTVRLYAAEALGRLGDPAAAESLALAAKDPDANVALAARVAADRLANGPAMGTSLRDAARSADDYDQLATPRVGEPAPEIDLPSSTGEPVRLSSHRGKPVVVLFQLADW